MATFHLREKLKEKGLKVTPQRLVILEAVIKLRNHPTAENIIDYVKKENPNISTGTIYKVLESLTSHNLLSKVKTERDIMRYDAVMTHHHHLYCVESDRIEDYNDAELDEIISSYFDKKKINGFTINDIKVQISGKFEP